MYVVQYRAGTRVYVACYSSTTRVHTCTRAGIDIFNKFAIYYIVPGVPGTAVARSMTF